MCFLWGIQNEEESDPDQAQVRDDENMEHIPLQEQAKAENKGEDAEADDARAAEKALTEKVKNKKLQIRIFPNGSACLHYCK